MKVTDQIDALKMLHTCPVNYLVVPRVVACCTMLPVLTVLGLAGCTWGLTTTCSQAVGRAATTAVVTTWVGLFEEEIDAISRTVTDHVDTDPVMWNFGG